MASAAPARAGAACDPLAAAAAEAQTAVEGPVIGSGQPPDGRRNHAWRPAPTAKQGAVPSMPRPGDAAGRHLYTVAQPRPRGIVPGA